MTLTKPDKLFPDTYAASRDRFKQSLDLVRRRWPQAALHTGPARGGDGGPATDLIKAPPLESNSQVIIFTTGLHGIEGYVGAAVLQLFIHEYLPLLNPKNTGLVLVHAINPWGMQQRRRTNENNVDLNRNFIYDWDALDTALNPDYDAFQPLFNPAEPVSPAAVRHFYCRLLRALLGPGASRLKRAFTLGQYRYPAGLYYGGSGYEAAARMMIEQFDEVLRRYQRLLLLDMHTGYGPHDTMTVVNSFLEKRSSAEMRAAFDYPAVAKTNPDEFYEIRGDMVDFLYTYAQNRYPDRSLYATSFEFGTLGDSLCASIRTLKTIIFENMLHRCGAVGPETARRVKTGFDALFAPRARGWREKAAMDARRALAGILRTEGYLNSP
ncbi:MAG: M14 family metallopeptidase [Bacillota bacterium]